MCTKWCSAAGSITPRTDPSSPTCSETSLPSKRSEDVWITHLITIKKWWRHRTPRHHQKEVIWPSRTILPYCQELMTSSAPEKRQKVSGGLFYPFMWKWAYLFQEICFFKHQMFWLTLNQKMCTYFRDQSLHLWHLPPGSWYHISTHRFQLLGQ